MTFLCGCCKIGFTVDQYWLKHEQILNVLSLHVSSYCSPEYTFPRQQEVINFASSTAFELVTLNPRTLVVCGSYSVGKEKVFLGECVIRIILFIILILTRVFENPCDIKFFMKWQKSTSYNKLELSKK